MVQRCQNIDLILGLDPSQDGISSWRRTCISVAIPCAAGQFMVRTPQVTDGQGALIGPDRSQGTLGPALAMSELL